MSELYQLYVAVDLGSGVVFLAACGLIALDLIDWVTQ